MKMISQKNKKFESAGYVQRAEIIEDLVLGVALKDPWKWGARKSPRHENMGIGVSLLDALFVSEGVCIVRVPYSLGVQEI